MNVCGASRIAGFEDGVSDVRFSARGGDETILAAGSWDSCVHVFTLRSGEGVQRACTPLRNGGPVLGVDVMGDAGVVSASLDTSVTLHDVETGAREILGVHANGASCVRVVNAAGNAAVVVSGGFDGFMRVFDARASPGQSREVAAMRLPGKCYGVAATQEAAVAVTSGRKAVSFDLRHGVTDDMAPAREVALPFQPRCVSMTAKAASSTSGVLRDVADNGSVFVVGGCEGKCSIEPLGLAQDNERIGGTPKPFSFRCHRRQSDNVVFPVHAAAFHPHKSVVFTGGGDGFVNAWDWRARKRVFQYARYPTSVAALAVNDEGNMLAVAASYAYEQGDVVQRPARDELFIRPILDEEISTKPRKA